MSWFENNPVASSLIGTGISSAGSITGSILNYYSQKSTNQLNRDLADLSYQRNVEQWKRENAYNHPLAQMQRLQDAGLNPNLVYGSGSAVQTSARSPQMEYPEMRAPNLELQLPNFFQDILNAKLKVAEIQNVESLTDKNNAEAGLAKANAIISGYVGRMRKFDSEHQQELYDETITELRNRIALQGWQVKEYESLQSEREERKKQLERLNKFWDDNPNLYWLKGLMDTLGPVVPGIVGIVESMIFRGSGKKGKKKIGTERRDSEGNTTGWTFDVYD